MKKIKWLLGAFISGQIITLLYKDKTLKEKISEAKGLDKLKILFNNLFDFNKKIYSDIKNYDYKTKFEEFKDIFEKEKNEIEKKINQLKDDFDKLNKEKIKPLIAQIEQKTDNLKNKIEENVEDIKEKYKFEEKIEKIKQTISDLKKKI